MGKNKSSKQKKNRRMKKKKDQRRYIMAKPKFKVILGRYCAIGLCIAMIICILGTFIAVNYYRDVQKREFYATVDGTAGSISEQYEEIMAGSGTEEEKMGIWKSRVRWIMNSRVALYGYGVCLYDTDSKEPFIKTKQVFNAIVLENSETEKKNRIICECEPDVMKELYDDMLGSEQPIDFEIKDIYVKNGEFIAGKLKLYQNDGNGIYVAIKEYDYTPKNTSEYTHIISEDNEKTQIFGSLLWWLVEKDETIEAMISDYVEAEIVEYDGIEENIWEIDCWDEKNTFWGWQYTGNEMITLDDGTEYMLVTAANINLYKEYGIWIILAYIVMLLLTLIICYSIAYRTYMLRLSHYQLDTYRRETTNAMAHDLKTPLMAISGYAENLRANIHSEKKDYYADTILKHVQYMNEMVGNILELAKVENVEWVLEKENVNLKSITEGILKKYEILTLDKKLQIAIEGETTIKADSALMTQAIENLIGNAMKYAIEDTVIQIQIAENTYEIRNAVKGELDTPVEDLWKPFVKGDNSRNEQKGTGVGLTIVKNIADAHGFELSLQCENQEFVARILY